MSDTTADAGPQPQEGSAQSSSAPDERLAYRGVFQRMLIRPEIGAAIGAVAIWVFFWAVSVPFGKAGGAASILDVASSPLGIMAVAVAMLMIGGEFDLSTGAATGAFGILLVLMVRDVLGDSGGWGLSLWIAIPLSFLAALLLGWFNGTVVDRTGLPSFIVTLGSFFVLRGAKLGYSKQIVEQIQVGRLDQLLLQADQERLIGLRVIDEAEGAQQQALLDSVGVTMDTPVPGLEDGNGTFGALLDAVRNATANDNARQLEELAELSRPFIDRSDKGYSTLNDIFAFEWIRNEHIWEWRDWGYTIGVVAGLSLIVLALYELQFKRRANIGTSGVLPVFGGLVVTAVGLVILGAGTISRPDNLLAAGIIAATGLAVIAAGALTVRRYLHRFSEGFGDTIASLGRGAMALPGIVIAIVGVAMLHRTDSVGGNTIGALLIAAGMLVGLVGWGMGRYERIGSLGSMTDDLADAAADLDDEVTDSSNSSFATPLIVGVVAAAVGVLLAWRMDSSNSTDVVVEWSLNGWLMFFIALVVSVGAGMYSSIRGERVASELTAGDTATSRALAVFIGTARRRLVTMGILSFLVTIFFLDQATVQGARAIFFVMLIGLAMVALSSAVGRARTTRPAMGSVLLILVSVGLAGLAFFVRAQSTGPKFRTQAFSVLLAIAALVLVWALATMIFAERNQHDERADGFGRTLAVMGSLAVTFGLAVRLLAVTQAELDAEITQTKFSVRVLWFLAFTAIATWVLGRTKFGSWTFAVGGNKDAARQVGVPASRTKTQLFMLTAGAAWLVGVLLSFRLNTIQASTGDGEEFEYIIAAVVGGNALTGGRGSTLGAAIGAFIMAMSVQGIPSARWNSDWRFVFVGSILLLAVIANNYIRAQAEASR